ncbi:heterokaryon incompatibility protein-domain-containing protein [Massariosphaeria phaeospora]|uniref:Heterokaryon incompatibility protein-domain-containing protein n=1 Tax=Massariosphaeria phaeospora TaxID=100035 RepID=A0A7C8IAN0_9PLEO|nr:heterokaryon incompatibility protein-domain-containing protein [Massariosphaeria phaeospora]
MTDAAYPGRALESGEIRLIRLLPGTWTDPIQCDLFQASLKARPEYRALSYVWGSRHVTRPIILKNQQQAATHAATINLERALRHLRHQYKEGLVLWVDALCINQKDVEERTNQVKLMGRIYESCKSVIVYLGSNLGRTVCSTSGPAITRFGDAEGDKLHEQNLSDKMARDTLESVNTPPGFDVLDVFSLIRMLAHGGHFTQTSLFTQVGDKPERDTARMRLFEALRQTMHTPWTPWWTRISCCSDHAQKLPRDQQKVLADFSHRVLDIEDQRIAQKAVLLGYEMSIHLKRTPLLKLLRRFRNRKASDPRDKVFALLSLAQTKPRGPEFLPDYTMSEREVFRTVTISLIYESESLCVLNTDLGRKCREDLPTWVPDWDAPGSHTDDIRAEAVKLYNACGIIRANKSTIRPLGHDVLKVEAKAAGKLVQVEEVMLGDSIKASRRTSKNWWRALEGSGTAAETFWRLMCADVIHMGPGSRYQVDHRRARPEDKISFVSWALRSGRSPFCAESLSESETRLLGQDNLTAADNMDTECVSVMDKSIVSATLSRRLFVTSKGHIGLGPANAQVGGQLVFMKGGRTPFILREALDFKSPWYDELVADKDWQGFMVGDKTCFELIGDCYAQDLMDSGVLDLRSQPWGKIMLV